MRATARLGLGLVALFVLGFLLNPAFVPAQFSGLSDGSDGDLVVGDTTYIELSDAIQGAWDDPVPPQDKGKGIYDANAWAVVYKYNSVTLNFGALRFRDHPSGAPVVWLVKNDVVISGFAGIQLSANGSSPGPGGFSGGRGSLRTEPSAGGLGPGGATRRSGSPGAGGGYSTAGESGGGVGTAGGGTYGNAQVFPLIGGSGGAGQDLASAVGDNGGGGGGAILIVAEGKIVLDGQIVADGGAAGGFGGGGSGGAIRLIAPLITGQGSLSAMGADAGDRDGGAGRIRLEANSITFTDVGRPEASRGTPDNPLKLFPATTTPSIQSVTLAGISVPSDPRPLASDVTIEQAGTYQLTISAANVPTNSAMVVSVAPRSGQNQTVSATFQAGNLAASTWTAQLNLKEGGTTIQARAILP